MRCASCEDRQVRKRAIIDVHGESVLSGYCRSCERSHFGEALENGDWDGDSRCLLCGDGGRFALALREIEYVETPDGEIRHETFPIGSETPRLCGTHLQDVVGLPAETETEQLRLPEVDPVGRSP
ncbi:hypothetical protein [Halorubrum sp. AS12]|uniref:hypothetical protein n=1 Tax=Halorubrum sp. AS12 TaxID=3409687 RepID=UPI003DA705E5